MRIALLFVLAVVSVSVVSAEVKKDPGQKYFYVYHDKGDRENHYIPSGWMGDYGDLKINDADKENPADGTTDILWTYNAKAAQGANWTGAYWQYPANNWGEKEGGFDLTGYKRLTFWAKADQTIKIADFKMGGITGEHPDSDSAGLSGVEVGKAWKKYTIDLANKDLTHIVGGFCWSASRDDNPNGFKLWLDEIRYEK